MQVKINMRYFVLKVAVEKIYVNESVILSMIILVFRVWLFFALDLLKNNPGPSNTEVSQEKGNSETFFNIHQQ